MRRYPRIVLLAALVALTPVLAGCENFDPDDWDFLGLNKKKPLPGERHSVFPNGVPGVTQGIPPEYQKSYVEKQQQEEAAAAAALQQEEAAKAAEAAAKKTAATEAAEKPKPKPKPKPKVVSKPKPPTQVTVQPARSQPAPQAPWPDSAQPPQQSSQPPPPAQGQQQNPAWPSAPPAGTFSR